MFLDPRQKLDNVGVDARSVLSGTPVPVADDAVQIPAVPFPTAH